MRSSSGSEKRVSGDLAMAVSHGVLSADSGLVSAVIKNLGCVYYRRVYGITSWNFPHPGRGSLMSVSLDFREWNLLNNTVDMRGVVLLMYMFLLPPRGSKAACKSHK